MCIMKEIKFPLWMNFIIGGIVGALSAPSIIWIFINVFIVLTLIDMAVALINRHRERKFEEEHTCKKEGCKCDGKCDHCTCEEEPKKPEGGCQGCGGCHHHEE